MRAVIYARYSSQNQRDASISDQFEICRRLIERQGWTLVRTYEDRAASGGSRFRNGYRELRADAERYSFDVVVVESLDRLGRKLADVADLHDYLTFLGIRLHTVAVGDITALHIGMLGTMAQMYLTDLREKTWRGQLGRVLKGRIPGGRAFGYDVVPASGDGRRADRGERRINEAEAIVVRRIFRDYAAGLSPRAIARGLNAECIPGPGGRRWGDTTIRGQTDRGTGVLNNSVYVGRLEWNRTTYVKDPRTGRRVARINPNEAREVVQVPELRIVDDELWARVKARQAASHFQIGRDNSGTALNRLHRQQFLLSGLLLCGLCGGGYTIMAKDRYGCAAHRSKGTCANTTTIRRQEIELRVLAGLRERLMAPEMVKTFIEEFRAEVNRTAREAQHRHTTDRRELEAIGKKVVGILSAIEDGNYNPSLTRRLTELEVKRTELEARLSGVLEPVVRLHPNMAEVYRVKVEHLEEALNEPGIRMEAAEVLRSLIDRIVLTPKEHGLTAELHGDLATILAFCTEGKRKQKLPETGVPGSQLSVVAGAGFEPATFRL